MGILLRICSCHNIAEILLKVVLNKGWPICKLCHTSQTWKVHQSVNYVTQAKGSTSRKAHVDYDGKSLCDIIYRLVNLSSLACVT
jgi:hypothetical protein